MIAFWPTGTWCFINFCLVGIVGYHKTGQNMFGTKYSFNGCADDQQIKLFAALKSVIVI